MKKDVNKVKNKKKTKKAMVTKADYNEILNQNRLNKFGRVEIVAFCFLWIITLLTDFESYFTHTSNHVNKQTDTKMLFGFRLFHKFKCNSIRAPFF